MVRTAKFFFFVAGALISASSLEAQPRSATVVVAGARIYDRPSVVGDKRDVPLATSVRVLDSNDEWYAVRIGDVLGWMPSTALRFTASPPTPLGLMDAQGSKPSTSGRTYTRGPRGGCYYLSGSGRKVYVDRSMCS